eukprot:454081_1
MFMDYLLAHIYYQYLDCVHLHGVILLLLIVHCIDFLIFIICLFLSLQLFFFFVLINFFNFCVSQKINHQMAAYADEGQPSIDGEQQRLVDNQISPKPGTPGYGNVEIDLNQIYFRYDSEKLQRLRFIRKVYLTLLSQLILTTSICAICMYVDTVRNYVINHFGLLIFGVIMSIVMLIVLFCVKDKYPINLICLFVWTFIEAYTIGVICGMYVAAGYEKVVIEAFVLTIVLFISLTIFTMQSKWDFSFLGAGLFACLWILIIWGIINFIFGFQMIWLYSLFGAIVFCLFIIFDTWWMLRRGDMYSDGDWILAAINLYLDVINLFLCLLQLFSAER